jgi:hypothetical protein
VFFPGNFCSFFAAPVHLWHLLFLPGRSCSSLAAPVSPWQLLLPFPGSFCSCLIDPVPPWQILCLPGSFCSSSASSVPSCSSWEHFLAKKLLLGASCTLRQLLCAFCFQFTLLFTLSEIEAQHLTQQMRLERLSQDLEYPSEEICLSRSS